MIDEAIETHLTRLISNVYPDVESDEIIFAFPVSEIQYGKTLSGHKSSRKDTIGVHVVNVQVYIKTEAKLDRDLLIQKLGTGGLTLEGKTVVQIPQGTNQKDFVRLINMEGVIFRIQYKYEINRS